MLIVKHDSSTVESSELVAPWKQSGSKDFRLHSVVSRGKALSTGMSGRKKPSILVIVLNLIV